MKIYSADIIWNDDPDTREGVLIAVIENKEADIVESYMSKEAYDEMLSESGYTDDDILYYATEEQFESGVCDEFTIVKDSADLEAEFPVFPVCKR